ncbi:MAG: potassium transporter [Rhodospirillales bacterium RIFCSPLOWO2_12_FULL_58_28]|nr:MAG: potassium transporter [Rhodospirillales bacterium RIFCSPLOWO2_02_FULL_58_16]OHC78398.1 MAG: potassium transporter [Rhodospirillales bacterium RIFCSPLOWO2_12_FULL_58_28]
MIVDLAQLLIFGIIVDWAFRKLSVPGVIGMLLLGTAFGPHLLNRINPELLTASGDLRMLALVVILLRAGFELSKKTLNKVGGRVALLSVVPALMEGAAVTVLGPPLLGLTTMESAVLGSVLAAVSPAVVVPMMIGFIGRGMGAAKGIPTMVLAASALDNGFVIVVYSALVGILTGQSVNIAWKLAGIPMAIALGIGVGLIAGLALFHLFSRFNPRATKRVLVILALSVILAHIEHLIAGRVPFAALPAIMAIGFIILEKDEHMAHELSVRFGKIWVFAEIVLFTLVGTQVNIDAALKAGMIGAAALIAGGLAARSLGVRLCLIGSGLNRGERLFVVVSYIPKATVQAAIGGGAMLVMAAAGMDTGPGEIILAVAVFSILLTAPLGALAIAFTGERTLETTDSPFDDARAAAIESEGDAQ